MLILLYLCGGLLFLASIIAHLWVKLRMRPGFELDEYHFEFEDHHPGYARYEKWSRITMTAAVVGALLLFVGILL